MPTYDYRCTKCGHTFELFHSIRDDTPKRCPKCRSKSVRVPAGGAGLLFKGSGFYITDYRSKSYHEKAKQEKGGAGGSSGKPDAGGSGGAPGGSSGASGGSGGAPGGSSDHGHRRDKKKRGSGD
jgi:putative FmdB family regulatory protein